MRRQGISRERITELDWWQQAEFAGLTFICTPTQHFSGRFLYDTNRVLWCSWIIQGREQSVYFGGDTGYFPEFSRIGQRAANLIVALLPIGAYRPRWFMKPVHMDYAEAAQAFIDLGAEYLIPIHWGTFDLADEPLDEPPRLLLEAADSLGISRQRLLILRHGETIRISPKN